MAMSNDHDLMQWLVAQRLEVPVEVDGETLYLKQHSTGAELVGTLLHAPTQEQLVRAMQQGFTNALEFDAGLGLASDGNSLTLMQWLPGVRSWSEAVFALENLLNQLASWRAAIAPPALVRVANTKTTERSEQRLRMMFAGTNR